jgi:hypothetical protein
LPHNVEIAPGYVVEFPDSMSEEQINRAAADLYQQRAPKSLGGLARNAVRDVKSQVTGARQMLRHPIETARSAYAQSRQQERASADQATAAATDPAVMRDFLASRPPIGEAVSQFAKNLGDAAYEEPVTAAMLAAPLVKPAYRATKAVAEATPNPFSAVRSVARKIPDSAIDPISTAVGAGLGAATGSPGTAIISGLAGHGATPIVKKLIHLIRGKEPEGVAAGPGSLVEIPGAPDISKMGGNPQMDLVRWLENQNVLSPMQQEILVRLKASVPQRSSDIGRSWNVGGKE